MQALKTMADLARTFSGKAAKVVAERFGNGNADAAGARRGRGRGVGPAAVATQLAMEVSNEDFAQALAFVAETIQQDVSDTLKTGTRPTCGWASPWTRSLTATRCVEVSVALANLVAHAAVVDVRHLTDLAVLSCFQGRASRPACGTTLWSDGPRGWSIYPVEAVEGAMATLLTELCEIMPADAPISIFLPALENVRVARKALQRRHARLIRGGVHRVWPTISTARWTTLRTSKARARPMLVWCDHPLTAVGGGGPTALTQLIKNLLKQPRFTDTMPFHEGAAAFITREWRGTCRRARPSWECA
jgi:hypothetical protein